MYKVQTGVAMPKGARPRRATRQKYPFEDMKKGSFFFVPNKERNTIQSYVSAQSKRLERTFSSRLCYMRQTSKGWVPCDAEHENAVLGVGVWRLK